MADYFHQKFVFDDSPWKPFFFADLYRVHAGPPDGEQLVYYIGGAGDSKRFEDRVATDPATLLQEFIRAGERTGPGRAAFLVSPAPLTTPEQKETRLDDFLNFFVSVLVPRALGGMPRSIALIGSAYGSFFASYLAFSLAECRSLALISGMGMAEAARRAGSRIADTLSITCYSNDDDEIRSWTDEFALMAHSQGARVRVVRGRGERRFDDYRENGAVRDAFVSALESLKT